MAMTFEFPTTSSALEELRDGDYDIVQLSKMADEAVKRLNDSNGGAKSISNKDTGNTAPSEMRGDNDTTRADDGSVTGPNIPGEEKLFHLHSFTLQLALVPPVAHFGHFGNGLHTGPVNENRTRFDTLFETIKTNFEPFEPFDLVEPTFDYLHIPLDRQGLADTKVPGFNVLLPSKLKRQNVQPLIRGVIFPYTHPGKEWLGNSSAWDTKNWIHAALALDPREPQTRKANYRSEVQRIFLKSGIKAFWESQEDVGAAGATLSLVLTVDCFVDLQKVWDPLPSIGHDLMGLIYHSLFPSSSKTAPTTESESRADSLRHFYACLRPARPVPYSRSVQPSNMPSKLLPFQNRTVAWLLQRERAPLTQALDVCQDPAGFWSTHNLETSGHVAYRRLTGELVKLNREIALPDRKGKGRAVDYPEAEEDGLRPKDREILPTLLDLSQVRGSMLCEEMGLGKTVEAIALILLNRHPLSNKRDHAAVMQVFEKTEELPSSPVVEPQEAPARPTAQVARGRGRGRGRGIFGRQGPNIAQHSAPKAKAKPTLKIPVIDLTTELDLSKNQVVLDWWQKEKEAFKTATVYDEQAEIQVSQVAATLIVTPPSLLKQWVAEMATHASSLRVCVYTGWKGLLASVEKRGAKDAKARNQSALAKRKKVNDRQRANTVRKYQRGTSGRVKVEIEDEGDSDEDELEGGESLPVRTQRLFVEYVLAHDVVITTYNDLSTDLTVAKQAPERARRTNVDYRTGNRPRSPLVMAEWFRVIMDEVQLCGDSSSAANMVSLIPRKHSLAVSGTPAKTDIKDLMGSLRFLRVPVLPFDNRLWHRLQQSPMRPAFDGLFQTIAVRTTKKEVAGEFDIPRQTRLVVPIELSDIEMHYYNDTLERQRVVLGLPADPSAARPEGWYLDRSLFRSSLQNLRQICTHIQVGQMAGGPARAARKANRLGLGNELLGLGEVLKKMKEDNIAEMSIATRAQLRAMIRKSQLILGDEDHPGSHAAASALYFRVETKSQQFLESLRQELAVLLEGREGGLEDEDGSGDEENSTADQDLSQHELEQRRERAHVRNSIREVLLILHQCYFFQGDFYHVQRETESEVESYNKAEAIRKELFAQPLKAANASISKLEEKIAASNAIESVTDLQTKDTNRSGGILSQEIMEQSNELLKIMNENALLVYNWREKIIELLKSPIDAEKDLPASGEEQDVVDPEEEYYAKALKAQGQVEAYLIAYAAAIADRREMMSEERSVLAAHDAKVKKFRTTRAAAQALVDSEIPADVPDDVAEQAGILMAERQALKDAREIRDCQRPLKALIVALNPIVLGEHRREEVAIARNAIHEFKAYIAEQSEKVDDLNKELDYFRTTFNRRVQYFAAYQIVSDSVTAPTYKNLQAEINEADSDILLYETQIARCQVKSRYLKHLGDKEQQGTEEEMRDDCIICLGSSDDAHGILLPCGHFFCVSCFDEYRKSATGKKCPACRTEIDEREGTSFRMGPKVIPTPANQIEGASTVPAIASPALAEELGALEDIVEKGPHELPPAVVEEQKRQADLERLNMMDAKTRREIASMDMMGEFGSKINFLIKHLLWYRIKDKSARHVVFSNWSDSLFIVIQALKRNGITFVSFDRGGKHGGDIVDEFLKNDSITVFLLHAEKESAGLTLTSCRVVHLLEPVFKHSFELQAIGRVDRLGQKEETTVYCYSTQDTVESRILSQGVRNGSSIYLKEEEQGDQVVEDMENVASAAHKGGDIGVDGNEEEMLKLIML